MNKGLRKPQEQKPASAPQSQKRGQLQDVRATLEFRSYSGPIPPPELLARYEELLPGSAERIFTQFEKQSSHRREMENKVVSSGAFSQRLGTISASCIGLIGSSGGVWLIHEGKNISGLVTLFGTLTGLVSAYLYKRSQQDKERARKNLAVAE